jgi:hypothetical protein
LGGALLPPTPPSRTAFLASRAQRRAGWGLARTWNPESDKRRGNGKFGKIKISGRGFANPLLIFLIFPNFSSSPSLV